jgi:pantoate--beta-alanine ligase
MGALHAGHASLIRAACASCTHVAVSLFVNPTQFGPDEDFARYPRAFEADCALAEAEGVDVLFAPTVEELYPNGPDSTFVEVPLLSDRLDGQSRPGHFRGVATVVAKLLIAAEPDRAFFGQKDAAQVAVVRRMAHDLLLATEIVVCPIVRDADGLALSSRNAYLTPAQRAQALTLSRAVRHAEALAAEGERRASMLIASAHGVFAAEPSEPEFRIDYIALVDAATLEPVDTAVPGTLFAVAAWVGATRLIDNAILC